MSFERNSLHNLSKHLRLKHPEVLVSRIESFLQIVITEMVDVPIKGIDDEFMECDETYEDNITTEKDSHIWNHYVDEREDNKAKCVYCLKSINFVDGSVRNLMRHLQTNHPSVLVSKSENYPNLLSVDDGYTGLWPPVNIEPLQCDIFYAQEFWPESKNCNNCQIDEELFKTTVAKHYHPFCFAENNKYVIPLKCLCTTRETVSKLIPQGFNKTTERVKLKLHEASAVCIALSVNNNFMAIIAHFININCELESMLLVCIQLPEDHKPENISDYLKETITKWGLQNKVVSVVSENVGISCDGIQPYPWQQLPCFSSVLCHIVKEALEESDAKFIIQKIENVFEIFKASAFALSKLNSFQKQVGLNEDLASCSSAHDILRKMVHIKVPVISTLKFLESNFESLTPEEWRHTEAACRVLEVFHQVKEEICVEKTVLLSKVILFIQAINKRISALEKITFPPDTSSLIQKLKEKMDEHFKVFLENPLSTEATILDPRFKKHGFSSDDKFAASLDALKTTMAGISVSLNDNKRIKRLDSSRKSLWDDFDEEIETVTINNYAAASAIELENYMQESLLYRRENPLLWWKERRFIYPHLYEIVKQRLCIVATSSLWESHVDVNLENVTGVSDEGSKASEMSQILYLNHK